jgi:hypothetical protein
VSHIFDKLLCLIKEATTSQIAKEKPELIIVCGFSLHVPNLKELS